jgi:hypothetical protein
MEPIKWVMAMCGLLMGLASPIAAQEVPPVPPANGCLTLGCARDVFEPFGPPDDLGLQITWSAFAEDGACACDDGNCIPAEGEDCKAEADIEITSVPDDTARLQNWVSQGVVGSGSYVGSPDPFMDCVPVPEPGGDPLFLSATSEVCDSSTRHLGEDRPWLNSISGYSGSSCDSSASPLWTHQVWVACHSCEEHDEDCE